MNLTFPTCSLCNQVKINLNLFACFHGYCDECLAKLNTCNNDSSSTNSCRECTSRFTDLSRDIGTPIQSPVNKYVSEVFKSTQLPTNQDKNAKLCHACSKLLRHDTTCSNYCAECRQQLCDECLIAHSQLSTTKNHRVMAAGDVLPLVVETSCSKHAEKPVEWYCNQCKLLMCVNCCIQQHRDHSCLVITEVADDRRSKLLQNANHSTDECDVALAHLEREKSQWVEEFESVNERISTEASEADTRLTNAKQILYERLQQLEKHVFRWFDYIMGAMRRKRENLQFIAKLRETVGKFGNACEVVCFYDAVALPDSDVSSESGIFNLSWPNGVINAPLPVRPVVLKPIELSNFVPSSFDCYSRIMKNGEQLHVDGRYETMTWEDTRKRLDEDARIIAGFQSRIRELLLQIDGSKKEAQNTSEELQQIQQKCIAIENAYGQNLQEVEVAKAKLEEMKHNNDESISEVHRLQQELSYSERLVVQREETIGELQIVLQKREQTEKQLRDEFRKSEQARLSVIEERDNLVRVLEVERSEAAQRHQVLTQQTDDLTSDVQRLQQGLSCSEESAAEKMETIEHLQNVLQQRDEREKLLEEKLGRSEQALLSANEQRDNLARALEAERSEVAQRHQVLTQQTDELTSDVQRLQQGLSCSEESAAEKMETIEHLQNVLQQRDEREKLLEEKLRKSEQALLSANEQRDNLAKALEAERRGVEQQHLAWNAQLSQLSGIAQDEEQTTQHETATPSTEEHATEKNFTFPTCSSCKQVKVDLNLFACFHSYCAECLAESRTRNNDRSSTNSCRECTSRFTDLSREIGTPIQSPVNKYVSKVFRTTQLPTGQEKNAKLCHACSKLLRHDTTRSNYCAECRQQLCEECVVAHRQLSTTRNHRVMAAGDVLPLIVETSCSNHAEKAVEWYCNQCKLLICVKCCIQQHRDHNCLDITEVADDRRSKLLQNANHSTDECNIALAHLEREKRHWIAEFKSVNERVPTEASEAAKRLMNAKQILYERLEQLAKHVFRWFDFTMGAMQRKRENLQFIAELREIVGKFGNPCEVVCFYDAVAFPDPDASHESSDFELSWPNSVIDAPLPVRPVVLKPIELSNFVPSSFDCYSRIMKNGEQLHVDGRYETMTWEDTRERLDEDARMIAEFRSTNRDLLSQIDKSKKEAQNTSEQLKQTEQKRLTIENAYGHISQEVEVAKAKLEEMKRNRDESISEVHRLQKELSYSEELVALKEETIDKLQIMLQQREETEKLLEDQIRKNEQARLTVIEELDNFVRALEAKRSELTQQHQILTRLADELLSEVQRLQQDLSCCEESVAQQVETIDQLQNVLQQKDEREKQLKEELRKSEHALISANEQRDNLARALEAERRGVEQQQLAWNVELSQLSGGEEHTTQQEMVTPSTEEQATKKSLTFPSCSSCNQVKINLNLFACFHSYCDECLAKWCTCSNDSSSTNSCRECTTRFTDLSREIGTPIQSPVNKYVSKVFRTTQLPTNQDKNAKLCHACSKLLRHDTTRSDFCAECRQQLCDKCLIAHSQLSTTKNHRVMAAGEVLPLIVQTSCSNHAEKAVEWYCDQCELLMCAKCCIQQHRDHNCLDITEVADDRRSKLLQNANHSTDECNIALAHLEREKRQWIAEFKSVNERISTEASEAAKRLMNAKQILYERLQQLAKHVFRWFDFTMGAMQRKRENLQFIAELRETVGTFGNPCEVVCFYDAVALPDSDVSYEFRGFNLSWPNGVIDAPLPIRPVVLKPIELSNFVPSSLDCYSRIMKNGEQLHVDDRYDTMTWEDTRKRLDEDARMIAELQSRIVQEVRMAKAKLEEMKQNNDESISELNRLQQEVSYSERLLAQKEETIAEFQSSNRDLQLQIGESKKEAHNNSEKLQQTQQRCVTLENAYRQKAREAEVAKAKMEEMRHTNYEAERSRVEHLQLANQAIMQQAQQLKEAWKSCEAQLSQSKAHEHQLEIRVKKLLSERLPPVAVPVCDDLVEGRARAPAYGITSIDSELYVLRMASSQIEVYSTETFDLQRRLTVEGIVDVSDMTSCTRYRCLYVADSKNGIVHRIQVDDAAPSSSNHRWFAVFDKPFGLSVTPKEHDVLVTCKEVNRLKQFKTNGELVRQIVLEESVVHPRHAVQLTTGQLIVCHGERSDTDHRACLMTADGKRVIASFVGNATREDDDSTPLDWPTHVAVDSCHGYVYVADYNNKRVVILNGDMVQIGQVGGSKRTMKSPLRLCLDGDVNRMYVAQCGGHVAVYSIHHPFQSMVLE